VVTGGVFRPFALVGGKAVATWRISTGEIELTPFGNLSREHAAALDADGGAVLSYLGA
jgi:hypothetical protein